MQQQAINVSAPGIMNASEMMRALAQDAPVRQAHKAPASVEASNPIYILGSITLGIPALLLLVLVGWSPGMQDGSLAGLTMLLVFSAFIVAAFFEIKRLADIPSEDDHH